MRRWPRVKADKAAIESAKAQLAAQQAAVDNTQVQLGYTVIASPIEGRTGTLATKVGNLITANQTELMTGLRQLQPVYVTFRFRRQTWLRSGITSPRRTWRSPPIRRTQKPSPPRVVSHSLKIPDVSTDTIKLKATFPNTDHLALARPVCSGDPSSRHTAKRDRRPEPGAANRPGRPVHLRRQAGLDRRSTSGDRRPASWRRYIVIDKGLQPEETIVTEGQLRLEAGTQCMESNRRSAVGWWRPRFRGAWGPRPRPEPGILSFEPAVNPSEVFIKRPIATSLLMAAIALFGIVAYRALPVSDLPTVDFPDDPGSGRPAGRRSGHDGVGGREPARASVHDHRGRRLDDLVRARTGSSNVTLQFDLARRIDSAAVDVQTAIAEVMPLLPAGMPTPPTFRKQNPADQGILYLGLTSNTVPMSVLDDYAETVIAPRISMVERRLARSR